MPSSGLTGHGMLKVRRHMCRLKTHAHKTKIKFTCKGKVINNYNNSENENQAGGTLCPARTSVV